MATSQSREEIHKVASCFLGEESEFLIGGEGGFPGLEFVEEMQRPH